MTEREWFEGVLGWSAETFFDGKNNPDPIYKWIDADGNDRGFWTPDITDSQKKWIEHVAKPMRGMGYVPYTRPDMFIWAGEEMPVAYDSEIIDDQIFQASLDAAESVPEVKERLQEFKKRGKIGAGG